MARDVVEQTAPPRNDAYTVLLTISLVAMIGACMLLYFDIQPYSTLKPTDTAALTRPQVSPEAQKASEEMKTPAPAADPAAQPQTPPAPPPPPANK